MLARLRRSIKLTRQRLTGSIYLARDDVTRAFTVQSLSRPELAKSLPYTWTGEAFINFWNAPLKIEVTTQHGVLNESQNQSVYAAVSRGAPSIKPAALDQIAEWFNATYADDDQYAAEPWYNAPLVTHEDVRAKVHAPRLVLDLSDTAIPGRFELHFSWRTHEFYDFVVAVSAWSVQPK